MNWLSALLKILPLIPVVVHGVETLHSNLSGSDKKSQALAYLGFGTAVAASVVPDQADTFNAVSNAVGAVIDATVKAANASGAPPFNKPKSMPAAAATATAQ